uniref:restriction endonuclease subunit S n=1 Tax=Ruthenibacterium lactatiformans TaxID=1550024 RepID=UPI003AB9476A
MKPEIRQRIEMIRRGEVPEGYKKKCGKVLPLTWDTSKMKEICIINPLRPEVIPEKVVFLSMTDVSEDGKILHQQKVDYQSVKQGFTPFQKGDVLVAKITPCFENGKGAHTENLVTDVGFGSTEFHVLRSKINSTYTFYHTVFENFRKKLEREMTGSAGQKRVQTASLANYSIAVPPAAEQQKIAAILTTQDKVIELKEKRLTEKLRQKKYLMQQLLTGRKRLPGFRGEWREEYLGKLFRERKETNCEGLEMLAITGTQGIIPRKELDLKDNSSEDKSKYLRVCIGDIGYNTM